MTDETTVHVIRHGRTALNAQGRFRGLEDVPLDAHGLAEAEAVASNLSVRPIVAITHSPLSRARQTAEAVGRALGLDLAPIRASEMPTSEPGRHTPPRKPPPSMPTRSVGTGRIHALRRRHRVNRS